jgi:hypothetical protein
MLQKRRGQPRQANAALVAQPAAIVGSCSSGIGGSSWSMAFRLPRDHGGLKPVSPALLASFDAAQSILSVQI